MNTLQNHKDQEKRVQNVGPTISKCWTNMLDSLFCISVSNMFDQHLETHFFQLLQQLKKNQNLLSIIDKLFSFTSLFVYSFEKIFHKQRFSSRSSIKHCTLFICPFLLAIFDSFLYLLACLSTLRIYFVRRKKQLTERT